jgi:hypothetical protein
VACARQRGASVIECCWDGLKALYDKTLHPSLASQVPVCRKTGISADFRWRCGQTSNNRQRKHRREVSSPEAQKVNRFNTAWILAKDRQELPC